jgi:membrane protein DedA with SNARE-associated domain
MSSIFSSLLSYLLLYKYLTLFVAVFFAAFIVPIPANNLLLAVGTFASQGYFSFGLSLVVATVANILGDVTGYLLAYKIGPKIIKRFHLKESKYFPKFERGLARYAGVTIFFSRFYTTVGSLVNFLAGVSVSFGKFLAFDTLGNFTSTLLFLTLGWLIGGQWDVISDFVSTFGVAIIVIVALILVIRFLFKKNQSAKTATAKTATGGGRDSGGARKQK